MKWIHDVDDMTTHAPQPPRLEIGSELYVHMGHAHGYHAGHLNQMSLEQAKARHRDDHAKGAQSEQR